MAPRALAGALADFSQRKSFTGPLFVQCSWPLILSLCPSIASPQSGRNVAALEDLASPGIDRQERFVAGREFGLGPGLDPEPQIAQRHDIFGQIAEVIMLFDPRGEAARIGASGRRQADALGPDR